MIKPTVGRVVWFYPSNTDPLFAFDSVKAGEPLAGHVAKVWSDTCVNLMVIDPNGVPTNRTSVFLYQGDTDRPGSCFAEWMPYQKGQAAKQEAEANPPASTSRDELTGEQLRGAYEATTTTADPA